MPLKRWPNIDRQLGARRTGVENRTERHGTGGRLKMVAEPQGPDARQRLVESAVELMRTKSPSAVTGRELAKRADVNYGLVHHYFGSKDEVFRAAMRELATEFAHDVESLDEDQWVSVEQVARHEPLWRVIAQFALDEEFRAGTEWGYPILHKRLASLGDLSEEEAQFRVAAELVLAFGWVVFKPLVRDAYGLNDEQLASLGERMDEMLRDLWRST